MIDDFEFPVKRQSSSGSQLLALTGTHGPQHCSTQRLKVGVVVVVCVVVCRCRLSLASLLGVLVAVRVVAGGVVVVVLCFDFCLHCFWWSCRRK